MTDLKPCPFCGVELIEAPSCDGPILINGVPVMWHSFEDCILDGKWIAPNERDFYWQRRADTGGEEMGDTNATPMHQ